MDLTAEIVVELRGAMEDLIGKDLGGIGLAAGGLDLGRDIIGEGGGGLGIGPDASPLASQASRICCSTARYSRSLVPK